MKKSCIHQLLINNNCTVADYHFLTTTTQILEGTIVYGYKGQNVNLTCIVNHNYDRRPSHIVWYHQKDVRIPLSRPLSGSGRT